MAHDILLGKTARDWSIGSGDPFVWTPAAVRGELLRVLGVLDVANEEVSRGANDGRVSPAEWKQWRQTYVTSHDFLTNASPQWGSNVDVARNHEQEANKWRKLVESRGGKLQGPPDVGRGSGPLLDRMTVALAVGGVAAVALLVTAIKRK